jgi:hypothetical protein
MIEDMPYGAVIDAWVPGGRALLQVLVDLGQEWLRALGVASPWLAAVVWGLGALMLLGAGALGSGLVALVRRSSGPPSPPAPPAPRTGMSPGALG